MTSEVWGGGDMLNSDAPLTGCENVRAYVKIWCQNFQSKCCGIKPKFIHIYITQPSVGSNKNIYYTGWANSSYRNVELHISWTNGPNELISAPRHQTTPLILWKSFFHSVHTECIIYYTMFILYCLILITDFFSVALLCNRP